MRFNEYRLEHGSYYLYTVDDTTKIEAFKNQLILMTDEVAICFDKESNTLHKHGIPKNVEEWYSNTRKKLIAGGMDDMANSLIIIQGAFPVEELNKVISNSSYIEFFYKKLMDNKIKSAKP